MADQQNPTQPQMIDLRTQDSSGTGGAQAGAGSQSAAGSQGTAGTTQTGSTTGVSDDKKGLFEKFDIPETVKEKYADLIPLILETESMSDEERQYWFQIIPIMTDDQISKLRDILMNEKNQLQKLDQEYNQEMKKINNKHVSEWKEFEAKEKREKLRAVEKSHETVEQQTEEELLGKLTQL